MLFERPARRGGHALLVAAREIDISKPPLSSRPGCLYHWLASRPAGRLAARLLRAVGASRVAPPGDRLETRRTRSGVYAPISHCRGVAWGRVLVMRSSALLHWLKVFSIVSFVINIGVLLMLILIFFFWKNSAPHVWVAIWAVLSIGLPLSAMLFVTIKARDNLKNIEAALTKGALNKKA
jgi:hypothetical protein